MKENILITGGSGFISKWLTEALDKLSNVNIYLLCNSNKNSTIYSSNVEKVYCDITDIDNLIKVFNDVKIDFIYHFAAKSKIQKFSIENTSTFKVNIQGTWNLLELARKKSVKGFVMASSMSVYGEKNQIPYDESSLLEGSSSYSTSKICAEEIAEFYSKTYNIPIVTLRLGMIFGGGDNELSRLIPSIVYSLLNKQNIHLKSTENTTIDPLYIKDLVSALLQLLYYFKTNNIGYEIMNISSNEAITISEIANTLVSISKNEKTIISYGELNSKKKYMNNDKAISELNWKIKYSLKQSLKETYLYYQMNKYEY